MDPYQENYAGSLHHWIPLSPLKNDAPLSSRPVTLTPPHLYCWSVIHLPSSSSPSLFFFFFFFFFFNLKTFIEGNFIFVSIENNKWDMGSWYPIWKNFQKVLEDLEWLQSREDSSPYANIEGVHNQLCKANNYRCPRVKNLLGTKEGACDHLIVWKYIIPVLCSHLNTY